MPPRSRAHARRRLLLAAAALATSTALPESELYPFGCATSLGAPVAVTADRIASLLAPLLASVAAAAEQSGAPPPCVPHAKSRWSVSLRAVQLCTARRRCNSPPPPAERYPRMEKEKRQYDVFPQIFLPILILFSFLSLSA